MDLSAEIERLVRLHGAEAVLEALDPLPVELSDEVRVPDALPDRYEDQGRIGLGAMGDVRRVRDRELDRVCALKVMRVERVGVPRFVDRFLAEARIGAGLQHPGIPPVYDVGRLADGRYWFTMKEVQGGTYRDLLRASPRAVMARLVEVFARVCDAVAYAHAQGVTHGDVKPANIVVGEHGEVLVVDWGSARSMDLGPARLVEATAPYLAPEAARGDETIGPPIDIYALGAVLYQVLCGAAPYVGPPDEVLRAVLAGPPPPLAERVPTGTPSELVELAQRCLSRAPDERPSDAGQLAREARAWLDGLRRRERALACVAAAGGLAERASELRRASGAQRDLAKSALSGVAVWEPVDRKRAAWAAEERADALLLEAERVELERATTLEAALVHEPYLPEAHAVLASDALAAFARAEVDRDRAAVARAEWVAARHSDALPTDHAVAHRVRRLLDGRGRLTLVTDPPGATVEILRYETRDRRLVEVACEVVEVTPLVERTMPHGSYLCVIRHPECAPVRYPVRVERGGHWDGVRPGGAGPVAIRLPAPSELPDDGVYVPAGWFVTGGDTVAGSPPLRRRWCDALVVQRSPVTSAEYVAFLNALVDEGRDADAVRHAPSEVNGPGGPLWGRDAAGRFVLDETALAKWDPQWPVIHVDHAAARAYLGWKASRTGYPWRLPGEYEWEKAARGVDGRWFPWGDGFDFSFACLSDSHVGDRQPVSVDRFPDDCSPYGVRGVAGNVQQWCLDALVRPSDDDARVAVPDEVPLPDAMIRMVRGGAWALDPRYARCAARPRLEGRVRVSTVGFRGAFRPWASAG